MAIPHHCYCMDIGSFLQDPYLIPVVITSHTSHHIGSDAAAGQQDGASVCAVECHCAGVRRSDPARAQGLLH